ncbi:MAG: PD-(D/E)XK nuclease family protein, partial [Candidatus Eisenbacteria bacterium]
VRVPEGLVVYGGQILQPVLYGLAAERLLGRSVVAGRLYFCTADGGFQERVVALDGTARAATQEVAGIIGAALEAGFLPAAPAEGACKWCDYRPVCGPWEEFRTSRKPANGLAGLKRLRGME